MADMRQNSVQGSPVRGENELIYEKPRRQQAKSFPQQMPQDSIPVALEVPIRDLEPLRILNAFRRDLGLGPSPNLISSAIYDCDPTTIADCYQKTIAGDFPSFPQIYPAAQQGQTHGRSSQSFGAPIDISASDYDTSNSSSSYQHESSDEYSNDTRPSTAEQSGNENSVDTFPSYVTPANQWCTVPTSESAGVGKIHSPRTPNKVSIDLRMNNLRLTSKAPKSPRDLIPSTALVGVKPHEVGIKPDEPARLENVGEVLRPHYRRVADDAEDAGPAVDVRGFGVDPVPRALATCLATVKGLTAARWRNRFAASEVKNVREAAAVSQGWAPDRLGVMIWQANTGPIPLMPSRRYTELFPNSAFVMRTALLIRFRDGGSPLLARKSLRMFKGPKVARGTSKITIHVLAYFAPTHDLVGRDRRRQTDMNACYVPYLEADAEP
ncbi:hypothetical protein CHU98_g8240 [Xylaria longipes]|nr:hypothetical protein CHU98_g8240 [Xylaria longipes]